MGGIGCWQSHLDLSVDVGTVESRIRETRIGFKLRLALQSIGNHKNEIASQKRNGVYRRFDRLPYCRPDGCQACLPNGNSTQTRFRRGRGGNGSCIGWIDCNG